MLAWDYIALYTKEPMMTNSHDREKITSGRKRISELRLRRRSSVSDSIRNSRNTIIINMIIGITSGVIFAVGLYFVVQFLYMRKPYMDPLQYKIIMGAFMIIACGWFIFLIIRIRSHYKRFREVSS